MQIKNEPIYIDIRSKNAYQYGHILNAINMPENIITEEYIKLEKDKNYIIYCKNGQKSEKICDFLLNFGYKVEFLKGGYVSWLKENAYELEKQNQVLNIEQSLRKKFHKTIFSKFAKAINDYDMLKPNDKVAVCISGGKDSMLLAKCFQEIKRHNKFNFELVFLVMDPGYSEGNLDIIKSNAKLLNIPIEVFKTDIFENVFNIEKSPCYICARMRRGHLYAKAKELGCNKIALGHHYDDVIETILMAMLYGAQIQSMMPKLHSDNFEGMELIRPLYYVREKDIVHWRDYNNLAFIQCACKFTENNFEANTSSKRKEVKQLIEELKQKEPQIEANIFKSVENVNLSMVIGYKDKNGKKHHFLDDYDNLI